MERQEKKHHHFVPQVYLRKFHHTKEVNGGKKEYFVSSFDKIDNKEKNKINVSEICAKKKFYTIESSNIKVRESIENFYADTIEKDYDTFYNLLINSQINSITLQERELIIGTIVNLHLRNYFWLKIFNGFWTSLIEKYPDGFNDVVYDEKDNVLFDFSSKTREQIIDKNKQDNKQRFIKSHLEQTIKWTKYHFHDYIIVESAPDNAMYLTSDKPVIGGTINSSLRLTLDSKHMLTLIPANSHMDFNDTKVFRKIDSVQPEYSNIMNFENAERFVIGFDLNNILQSKILYEKALTKLKSKTTNQENKTK
jgi:hypothetical protein